MKNETANKVAFLVMAGTLTFLVSWVIGSADFFSTVILALIVGVFCWDIEKTFEVLKKGEQSCDSGFMQECSQEVKDGKVTAYIINLDRAKKRWDFIEPQVKKLGIPYKRVAAIDGHKLSKQSTREIVDTSTYTEFFRTLPEAGTVGCALSHEKVWRRFLESDSEFALIFEDDVLFDSSKLSKAVTAAVRNKDLWDILSFESNHYGYPQKIARLTLDNRPGGEDEFLVLYMTNVKHSGAYLIGRDAVKKLLEKFYPIKMPLDHYYSRSWEFGLRFCGAEPRIVEQKFGDSQIKSGVPERISTTRVLLINVIYNVYTEFMRTAYNGLLYLASRRKL